VGAGPGGLGVAAALRSSGIPAVILERASSVGASWRGHYERLHLHTARTLSGLPGLGIPRAAGTWVSRDDFVAYLETYARHHGLDIRLGLEVHRLDPDGPRWRVETSAGALHFRAVVVATGQNCVPFIPSWPGRENFPGAFLHSSRFRSGEDHRGQDVLVVGAGNSGAEIAVDLVEHGAARVSLSIRRPPNVVPRAVAGLVPAQFVSILLSRLPLAVADAFARATARLTLGDLASLGLPHSERGIYTEMVRDRQIPIIDVGLVAALRARRLHILPAVEGFEGRRARLQGGGTVEPDAVIAATGYRAGLERLVGHLAVLGADGSPIVDRSLQAAPGLHFVGFSNPPTGNLRQMRIDAWRVARRLRQASARAAA